jgi:hypothetical protein
MSQWTTLITVLVFILIIPMIFSIAGRSGLRFKWPGIFLLFTLLFFASQSVPPYYAMGWRGDSRLQNIIYYSYFWLLLVNLFYFFGWLQKTPVWQRLKEKPNVRSGSGVIHSVVAAAVFVLLVITAASPSNIARSSSGQSAQELLAGDAQSYGRQMYERLSLYNDSSLKDVRVPELTVKPSVICLDDITDDPKAINNQDLANYYHKASVATVKGK